MALYKDKAFEKMVAGYQAFREKYATGDDAVMQKLHDHGQTPEIMVVACSDSRVDPALILQCDPGDLFTVRNVANIIPPYESDKNHHGTSSALEFGLCYLKVKHLVILGHSQCGGIQALLSDEELEQDDFISGWVSIVGDKDKLEQPYAVDDYAKQAMLKSYENCINYPWIKEKVDSGELAIHLWFFHIQSGEIYAYLFDEGVFKNVDPSKLE